MYICVSNLLNTFKNKDANISKKQNKQQSVKSVVLNVLNISLVLFFRCFAFKTSLSKILLCKEASISALNHRTD